MPYPRQDLPDGGNNPFHDQQSNPPPPPTQGPGQPQAGSSTQGQPPPAGQSAAKSPFGAGQFPGLDKMGIQGDPKSQDTINAFINDRVMATQGHAATPDDLKYWGDAINKVGGLGTGEYWYNKMTDPNGQGANAGGGGGAQFAGGQYTPWQADPREAGLFSQLMDRAKQSLNVSPNDPIIAGQVGAYGAQQQRGLRDYESQLAESGGPNANMSMEQRMGSEKASQATGQMQAQLMQNELNARRQEIQNALAQMGGMLTSDQQMQLQKELAYLSDEEVRHQMGLQAANLGEQWDYTRSTGGQ